MKKILTLAVLSSIIAIPGVASEKSTERKDCLSTREYITVLKYLEERKEFQIEKNKARNIADEISKSCSGAAESFIKVMNTLIKAEIDGKTALTSSMKLASQGKESTDAFIEIFKSSFIEKLLDRDAQASYKIAMSFAQDFKGDLPLASKSFFAVATFCSEEGKVNLPKNRCVDTAQKIGKLSGKYKTDMSLPFLKLMDFMMGGPGPNLPLYQALEKSEKAVEAGPMSEENFIQAYKFASAKDGLALGTSEAISFAEKMASRSSQN